MKQLIITICSLILLTGCWDKRLLKDHSLILAIGYDLNDDDTISKTVSFPIESINQSAEEQIPTESDAITTTGNSVGDADIELERYLSQNFDRSKARVLLIGENLAQEGVFPALDSMYRDPRGPLGASVAVISERARDGLNLKKKQSFLTSEFYFDLLISSEESGIIKRLDVQEVCPLLLSGTKDIGLPHLRYNEEDASAHITGIALFKEDQMTDTLPLQNSIMLLILMDDIHKKLKINLQINDEGEREGKIKDFVTFTIRNSKRKFKVYKENDEIKAKIDMDLKIEIEEYPHDHLYKAKELSDLAKAIHKQLLDLAEDTIERIQKANSDTLGIGDKVKAHYYDTWTEIDWREVYPNVPIDVNFEVDIVQHGIIN